MLYFDTEENRVGMQPVADKDAEDGAYTLSISESGASVTPSSFLNKHQLVPEITTQYEPERVQVNQNLELVSIDLDDPLGTYGSRDEDEAAESEA